MTMISHNVAQGTEAWSALRANHLTASEAPAALGASKYQSRTDLLYKKKTGISKEVDSNTHALFDKGHAAEAVARPLAEEVVGDDLSPTTVSREVDGLPLLASLDGITLDGTIIFEHKLYSQSLAAQIESGELEPHYTVQMDQQLLVTGAKKCLFVASDGTRENFACCWYETTPAKSLTLIAGWKQFLADLKNYTPTKIVEMPKADVTIDLPALFVHAKGEITTHNMDEFGRALTAKLAETRAIVLATDQDFSNAKEAAKKFRETAKAIALSKEQMLAQTETIGEAARKMDAWAKDLNATALQLEKDVEREDKAKKDAMVLGAKSAYAEHIAALEAEISPIRLILNTPLFAEALKSKRNYTSMQDAVDTMLANAKAEADMIARDIRQKLELMRTYDEYKFLFADLQQIISKQADDFRLLVTTRIEDHKRAEAERIQRIEAEAKAKAEREAAAKAEAEAARIRAEERAKAEAEAKALQDQVEERQSTTPNETTAQVTPIRASRTPDVVIAFIAQRGIFGEQAIRVSNMLVAFIEFHEQFGKEVA